ncbi:EamA family transporter RarD [Acinetobacter stercoris]|uniref:EamA-like transporter family protein n=1 Tax=Acinetobacter stercoris TaxID=2126983 RepID=A0A2U3MWD8_9GAMM|nr:EamA family transporter RarD [Acinetobacter stercoris]SPL69619.1 EamA-like transporter family protein [Acinetobacter stercoris]
MLKGIFFSIFASFCFALLYYYTSFLHDLNGNQAFGWRMFILFPFLTIFIVLIQEFSQVRKIFKRFVEKPAFLMLLILSSFLSGLQLWLFMWAPMNNRALQVSLGYFLLPLVLILCGYLFFKEKISIPQKIALSIATLGVLHEIWRIGSLSWESLLVAIGYAAYFVLRKKIDTNHLAGFWWDTLFMLPIAIYFIQIGWYNLTNVLSDLQYLTLVLGLGFISALALGSYILSSKYLPLVLFGLLAYVEPVLLAIVSLLLGESIQPDEWLTYIPIWIAVAIIISEGIFRFFDIPKWLRL